jgi:hypothetical protein
MEVVEPWFDLQFQEEQGGPDVRRGCFHSWQAEVEGIYNHERLIDTVTLWEHTIYPVKEGFNRTDCRSAWVTHCPHPPLKLLRVPSQLACLEHRENRPSAAWSHLQSTLIRPLPQHLQFPIRPSIHIDCYLFTRFELPQGILQYGPIYTVEQSCFLGDSIHK